MSPPKWQVLASTSLQNNARNGGFTRWVNYVSPDVVDEEWGPDDNLRLLRLHAEHNNHWKDIAPRFPGRTDNCVKNQLFSILRKALRKLGRYFLKDEMILPINEIKPKIVTDFLKKPLSGKPDLANPTSVKFETVRDLVEYFVAHDMNEASLDLSASQEESVVECFRKIFEMKCPYQPKVHTRKEQ